MNFKVGYGIIIYMKSSSSFFGMKKIARILLVAVVLTLAFFAAFYAVPNKDAAFAAGDLDWEVFIKYRDGSVYSDIPQVGVCKQRELWFFVSGYSLNDSYEYCVTKSPKTTKEDLDGCDWTLINASGSTSVETISGVDYIKCSYTVDTSEGGISRDYYYFRHVYQVPSGDTFVREKEYYAWENGADFSPIYWYITVNVNDGNENAFRSIQAKYLAKGATVESKYDGTWTANPVTFTVTTATMEANAVTGEGGERNFVYNESRERISYSENFNGFYETKYREYRETGLYSDAEAQELAQIAAAKLSNWQFFRNGNNEVSVSKSLDGVVIWFRVTDIAGEYPKFSYYGRGPEGLGGEPYFINIDPATPNFDVSAQTYNVEAELIDYQSASWTSNSVHFRLSDTSRCISGITYQYSANGAGFTEMGGTDLEITVSTNPVLFRAVTEAGKYFEYSFRYVVNIDGVSPQILSEGYTIDPDGENTSDVCDKKLSSTEQPMSLNGTVSAVTVYDYANNKITVKVYNRNAEGKPVFNASGVTFYYQDARARNLYTNNWQKMTDFETSGDERFYRYSLAVGTDISRTQYVKFKIVSGAGLSSSELEVCVTVVNSVFTFTLPDDNYLIAQYNQDGWISDKATIRAIVSVDSVEHPTTQYTFYYWTDELTGEGTTEAKIKAQASSSVGVPVEFYDEKNGEILWIYEFDLVASANAFFNMRAMNAAKKLNGDTKTTYDIIRIDVLEPTYTWDAYVYPTTGEISPEDLKNIEKIKDYADDGRMLKIADKDNPDAGWVNGSIYLVVAVDVGVSGINLKDMAFAKDGNGNPMYDTAGNLVWQEVAGVHTVDFHEANTAGSTFGKYYYFFSLNNTDASKTIAVSEYRYRIYTGSGISTDISFSAKFDSTEVIRLKSVDVNSATGKNSHSWSVNAGSGVLSDPAFSVCEDISLSFASSLDAAGVEDHYRLFYYPFTADMIGMAGAVPTDSELLAYASRIAAEDNLSSIKKYVELTEDAVNAQIASDSQGTLYFAVYLKSKARNWQNVSNSSGFYVLCVEYDTLNITLQYRLDALSSLEGGDTDEDDMASGVWKRGALEIYVTLPIDDKGTKIKAGDGYTYYYMLISFGTRGEIPDVNTVLSTESNWIAASGDYNGSDEYVFTVPFTGRSFYGYIGLSVCNKAKYRSIGFESIKILRVDNTTPDILRIIQGKTADGLVEERVDEATTRKIVSVNTKDEITLNASAIHADLTHSAITYYYMRLSSIPTDVTEKKYSTVSDMTLLENSGVNVFSLANNFSKENFCTVYLMIFAINGVATHSTGFAGSTEWETGLGGGYTVTLTTIYEFNYDPSELSATALAPSSGSADYNDGMYEFTWQEVVGVSMTVKSNKRNNVPNYYRFMFSVDSGSTWYNYMEAGAVAYYSSDEMKEIRFTADSLAEYTDANGNHPFENGVLSTFYFRAVNKAGSYVDCGNVYIAIDETIPEFEVVMHDHNGLVYIGGNTVDFNSGDENWTNGPVTVNVNITRMPASGVRVYYYLRYLNSNKSIESPLASSSEGKGKELVSYEQFTTDRLDGFNLNRDAVIVITAVSRSGASNIQPTIMSVRVSVDQQTPVFTMTGKAYEENDEGVASSIERIIASGEWTGMNTVSVTRERTVANVSPVVYTYTWQDETMNEPESHIWSDTEVSISRKKTGKLIVTATSANGDSSKGKTYTVEFDINIDTTPPTIEFSGGINVIEGSEQYIDLQVVVHGDNLDIVEYITVKEDTRGFTFDPTGYVLSTSSVDNSTRHEASEPNPDINYRGYVNIYVRDKAGHEVHFQMYVVPFPLTVNTIQLTDEDKTMVDKLEHTLGLAVEAGYMEKSRIEYFENMISRLRDRMETLQTEIDGYRDYLEKLANRSSFELRSDYAEMLRYRTTFQNYEVYGQKWIQTAITGDSTSRYYAYYKNFLNQFDKLFALMEQVERVETHVTELPAINMVEAEDYTEILRVYDEYFDLSQDQKSCFTSNLYNKLMDLKEACEVLLLSDKETGVILDGDFAPGATVAVTDYNADTDTYKNAQALLMNTVQAGMPRAIVSIHRVSLTGAYAQTAASDIEVQLPIPEEYRSYIYFDVYSLADDGSMRKVNGSIIQPDGKSVRFSTANLGTFVLCVTADIQEQEVNTDSYGSIFGIPLTATMIKYLLYIGGALFALIFLVFIIMGIRQRRFMNSYNRAYRNSVYRRQARGIPKGNKIR